MKELLLCLCVLVAALNGNAEEARYVTMTTSGGPLTNSVGSVTSMTNELHIAEFETAELVCVGMGANGNSTPYVLVEKDGTDFVGVYGMIGTTVAGPATIKCFCYWGSQPTRGMATIKITPAAFPPDRTVLVPPGTNNVSVVMEQSTNLRDWSPATNGMYGGSDVARFFRIHMAPAGNRP